MIELIFLFSGIIGGVAGYAVAHAYYDVCDKEWDK
jgi:hypothetical protein